MGKLLFAKFVRSNFEIAKTSATALLLLLIERHLETQFVCPGSKKLGIAYSFVFIVAPCVPLLFLHIRLSIHCKFSDMCCKKSSNDQKEKDSCVSCSTGLCCYYVFECLYALTLPFCWILIVAIDGRYVTCFYEVYEVNGTTSTSIVPIIQMSGLATTCGILTLLLMKPCNCLVNCWRKRSCVQIYYRKKHEHLTLKEVKPVTHRMVGDKRNTYVKGVVDEKGSLTMTDPDTLVGLHTIIHNSKEKIKENLKNFKKTNPSGESGNPGSITNTQTTGSEAQRTQPAAAADENNAEGSTGGGTGDIRDDTAGNSPDLNPISKSVVKIETRGLKQECKQRAWTH